MRLNFGQPTMPMGPSIPTPDHLFGMSQLLSQLRVIPSRTRSHLRLCQMLSDLTLQSRLFRQQPI
jgi:hypothetical protein